MCVQCVTVRLYCEMVRKHYIAKIYAMYDTPSPVCSIEVHTVHTYMYVCTICLCMHIRPETL